MKKILRVTTILLLLIVVIPTFSKAESPEEVHIAMAQIFLIDGDREGNFVRIENAIVESKSKRADIVVFPETTLLGWVNPEAHYKACTIPGKDSDRLCKLAQDYNLFICIGLAEKDSDGLYDSAILIDNTGKIILKHRKINTLPNLIDPPYKKGKDINTVATQYGNIGMMICADSFKDSIINKMNELQPSIVLIPYGWAEKLSAWPDHGKSMENVIRNVARKTNAIVVGVNCVGSMSHAGPLPQIYGGQSVIVSKDGAVMGKCRDRDSEIKVIMDRIVPIVNR